MSHHAHNIMTLRTGARPAAPVRHRSWFSSLHRPVVVGTLLLCLGASFVFVWRPWLLGAEDSYLTSLSGHSYHPKLCAPVDETASSSATAGNSSSSTSGPCSELHDPRLSDAYVQLPQGFQLQSSDPEIQHLHQLLQDAIQRRWPLPLARRAVSLLLQGAVPRMQGGTGSSSTAQGQGGQGLQLTATESGHAAGWSFASAAAATLQGRSQQQLVPCSFDPSLPTDFHTRFLFSTVWPSHTISSSRGSSAGAGDSAFTATYSNSSSEGSSALGNSVLQLLTAAALLPAGSAYISLAVPADAAADSLAWLDLLQLLAAPLGLPVHLALDTQQAAGVHQVLQPGLAASRAHNAALSAFFPAWRAAQDTAAADQQEAGRLDLGRGLLAQQQQPSRPGPQGPSSSSTRSLSSSSSSSSSRLPGRGDAEGGVIFGSCPAGAPAPACYEPEFVVLLEPLLYMCASDLVRLMEYPYDLVCGITLDEGPPPPQHHRARAAARKLTQQQQQQQQGSGVGAAAGRPAGVQEGPVAAAVAAAARAVLQPEVPREFELHSLRAAYDAVREISGELLSAHAPYFTHSASLEVARAGLPVPVYCCWGGAAKLRAAPLAAGLRFRGGEQGECHPPDPMSLMCDDLWRTGRTQILLDPGVRTSSQLRTKALFENPRFPFFYYTQNWETTAWFDIHPLLPLQYWNKSTTPHNSHTVPANSSSSSSSSSPQEGVQAAPDELVVAPVWTPQDWEPGQQQLCCEGQEAMGAARPNHPTNCRHVSVLSGTNFTQAFLLRCADGSRHRQDSQWGDECG